LNNVACVRAEGIDCNTGASGAEASDLIRNGGLIAADGVEDGLTSHGVGLVDSVVIRELRSSVAGLA